MQFYVCDLLDWGVNVYNLKPFVGSGGANPRVRYLVQERCAIYT